MVFVQTWQIFQLFLFLGNIRQENVFYDILERKNAFLGYKNKKFKESKYWDFSKGLTHGFGPKMANFPTFFFSGNIGLEDVFYDILERENAFVGYKNKKFKNRKIDIFPKRLNHRFGQKWPFFRLFLFRQYRPVKCLLRYSRAKKRFSRLWKREVQKLEKSPFFQRG